MAMTIRFYFSIFMDVGKMYGEVSKNHIMPGVELCNQLSVPSNIDGKMRALLEFTNDSQRGVSRIVQAVRKKFRLSFLLSFWLTYMTSLRNKTKFSVISTEGCWKPQKMLSSSHHRSRSRRLSKQGQRSSRMLQLKVWKVINR